MKVGSNAVSVRAGSALVLGVGGGLRAATVIERV